ncbi:MAG TPA: MFS transporter [Steroidobacteraceae bacterium]|nr:MFS transporter [Steroidobacteraceae bacterium]
MQSAPVVNLEELIDRQDVRRTLLWVLLWAGSAMLADGYDLLSIALVAPTLIEQWQLTVAQFSTVFTIGAAASMLGGAACGYLADRIGRKRAIVAGTLLLGVSTLGSAYAANLGELIAWRALASFGIGTVPPVAIALVNEFAPRRLRATSVALLYLGTTLGVLLAGFVTREFVPAHGWPIVFLVGGIGPLAVALGLAVFLRESPRYLATRKPGSADTRRLAEWLAPGIAIAPDARFVLSGEPPIQGDPLRLVFSEGRWRKTLVFWIAYFACGFTLYTMLNYSPIILRELGLTKGDAALLAAWASVAGWMGGVIITRGMDRWGLGAMILPPLIGIPLIGGLGSLAGAPGALIAVVTLLGGMIFSGSQAGLHATGALLYPTAIRANGIGLGLLVTRSAGVLSPIVIAGLYAGERAAQRVLWAAALPLAVVAACFLLLSRLHPRTQP